VNENELAVVEEELRSIFPALGLDWVLAEVDRTFGEGVPELRYLRRGTYQRYSNDYAGFYYEAVAATQQTFAAANKNQGTPVVTVREMTQSERVLQLIDTALIVLVELPEAEEMAVEQIAGIAGNEDEVRISFIDGRSIETMSSFRLRANGSDSSLRTRLRNRLRDLRNEVAG
jgi:hypothetical protein